jgi:AcrR family transcriptional regulator
VAEPTFTRRSSYGPTSPTVGTRGARTRQEILDAALQCFTERGFHNTAVEDICTVAETSRATLYQYFASKDAVFVELMHRSGARLHRVTRRLEPLGPSAAGYEHLHHWLLDWSAVFDRYSAMFIEWANVNSPNAPLRPKLTQFVDAHVDQFVPAMTAGGFQGADPRASALMILAIVNRFHYIRHVYRPGLSEEELGRSLTTAIQLFLFPDTPRRVLAAGPPSSGPPPTPERAPARPPIVRIGPLAGLPPRTSIEAPRPFDGLSAQAAHTVRQLLDAAGRVFASVGYTGANVDQIVNEAGLARGTFYRYFTDKAETITALAYEAASVMCPLFVDFGTFADDRDPARLRQWLGQFFEAQARYSGVLRAWTEAVPIAAALLAPAADVVAAMSAAMQSLFGPERAYPLERRAAGLMLAGLLEHFPTEGSGTRDEPSPETVVETQAVFVERVLLDRPPRRSAGREAARGSARR